MGALEVNAEAIEPARLGFGCANVPGPSSRREALTLLETALDHGVRHFDVARMYGDGAAEGIVGELAKRRRADMVIVTKAGIAPASRAIAARAMRRAMAASPWLTRTAPASLRAAVGARFGLFAPDQVRQSLETSLRELQTDHVDALLLHECLPQHIDDDLKRALERFRAEGKIGGWGIATSAESTATLIHKHPDLCDIVQVNASAATTPPPATRLIVHSILGERFGALLARLAADEALAAAFTRDVGVDAQDRAAIASLLIQRERVRHPAATLLISSNSPSHVRRNANLFTSGEYSMPTALDRFLMATAPIAGAA
jgi:diketogulonate reductase-like aldo/keto reductase